MHRWMRVLALVAGLNPLVALAQTRTELPDPATDSGALQYDAPVRNLHPGEPLIPSFQRRTATKAGGPANELNTGDKRATERLRGGSYVDAATGRDLYHGNYCGHDNRGYDKAAVDELDAACRRHDVCFDATNRSCNCNEALRQDAYRVVELKTASRDLRTRAVSVMESVPAMLCTP